MIKKTLASLLIGSSLLFGNGKVDSATIDVPIRNNMPANYLQSYIDIAKPGDTLNFVKVDSPALFTGITTINKDINFEGNGYWLHSLIGTPLIFVENSIGNINNLGVYADNSSPSIGILDNSSLNFKSSTTNTYGEKAIYFNSTGDLTIKNIEFYTHKTPDEKKIYLEKIVGNISIEENVFTYGGTAIYINENKEEDKMGNLNIMNNTIHEMSDEAIYINSPMNCSGYIINNSISNCNNALTNEENLGNIVYSNNNIFIGNPWEINNSLESLLDENFDYNPLYVSENDFHLSEDSPLWNKGLYVENKTPWFPNEDNTWIGAYGNVPEPDTLSLLTIAGLSACAYKWRKR